MDQANWRMAIDTSGPGGGLAWWYAGELRAVDLTPADASFSGGLHARLAAQLSTMGLTLHDVRWLAISGGPGSFTGLRIAAAVAATLNALYGCGVVRISTLAAIAEQVRRTAALPDAPGECGGREPRQTDHPPPPPRLAVLMDARPGWVYCAEYQLVERAGSGQPSEYREVLPAALRELDPWLKSLPTETWLTGPGLARQREQLEGRFPLWELPASVARVVAVGELGWAAAERGEQCRPGEITPLYLRQPECEEVYEQRRAAARQRRGE